MERRHNLLEQKPNHAVLTDKTHENLKNELAPIWTEILEVSLCDDSKEVAVYIVGYVCKHLNSKSDCKDCMILHASAITLLPDLN